MTKETAPMNFTFPVFVDLENKPALVIGSGEMAEQRANVLRASGARVTVVADAPRNLEGYFVAISTLTDKAANKSLFEEAERLGVLFSAHDDPAHCRFVFPSLHRSGDLTVAVSTNGRCPALAVRVREQVQNEFGPGYGEFLKIAAEMRPHIAAQIGEFSQRSALWYRMVDSEAIPLLANGRRAEAKRVLERILAEERVDYPIAAFA